MKTIILVFILTPFVSFAQLIKSNQADSFTHQKRIVTKEVNTAPDFAFSGGINSISFNTIDNNIFIELHGFGKSSGTIMQNDIALLVTEKDTITIKSLGLQISYGKDYAFHFDHEYFISKEDVFKLSKNKLLSIRQYNSKGIFDFSIKEKFQSNLMKLSDALLKEMSK